MSSVTLSRIGRILLVIFLEGIAVLLALYQGLSGVYTDEAKYLLNIPYPHPPLARSLFHAMEFLPQQELLVRIVLATLLIQAVWLVGSLARNLSIEKRVTLCGFWLFSGAVLFQAGTIMMAPLTALQGLLFVWLYFREENVSLGWIALMWLASLFTAYQAILYLPIVFVLIWRSPESFLKKVIAFCIPLLLVVLYVLTNPLAIASFTSAGGQNAALSLGTIAKQAFSSWLFAGSAVFSVVGTVAVFRSKKRELIGSFLLVALFLCVSFRAYYSILFLPLFVAGVIAHSETLKRESLFLALHILAAVYIFSVASLQFYENTARTVMRTVNQSSQEGVVLIAGGFGHQWQYESTSPIFRYRPALLSKAKAVVCLEECPGIDRYAFYQVSNLAQEVWIRQHIPYTTPQTSVRHR
ncbi:MAG: hypothetical protein KC680_00140 [Candidatus Peregrinibacteria bacterium]|nr:hypothetical protein [Candidatus Peregrinibacteria bacterium]MCB9808012.1 hypothetical protein [Candidatus Peribacteria bacterium]